jgi:hypothetical protein
MVQTATETIPPSDTSRVAEPDFSYSEQLEQTIPSVPLDRDAFSAVGQARDTPKCRTMNLRLLPQTRRSKRQPRQSLRDHRNSKLGLPPLPGIFFLSVWRTNMSRSHVLNADGASGKKHV